MNKIKKFNKKTIIILIIFIAIIIYYLNSNKEVNIEEIKDIENISKNEIKAEENKTEEKNQIIVHITGAIKKEGVYKLEENSRITDLVNLAGGLKEDANMSKINLASKLEDGMKINIPSINDPNQNNEINQNNIDINNNIIEDNKTNNKLKSKININTATKEELDTLPGIGEATAEKIIEYRKKNGKFSNIEELKEVSGIGDSKFENIKNNIEV